MSGRRSEHRHENSQRARLSAEGEVVGKLFTTGREALVVNWQEWRRGEVGTLPTGQEHRSGGIAATPRQESCVSAVPLSVPLAPDGRGAAAGRGSERRNAILANVHRIRIKERAPGKLPQKTAESGFLSPVRLPFRHTGPAPPSRCRRFSNRCKPAKIPVSRP